MLLILFFTHFLKNTSLNICIHIFFLLSRFGFDGTISKYIFINKFILKMSIYYKLLNLSVEIQYDPKMWKWKNNYIFNDNFFFLEKLQKINSIFIIFNRISNTENNVYFFFINLGYNYKLNPNFCLFLKIKLNLLT